MYKEKLEVKNTFAAMIQIDDQLISTDVLDEAFVCDLNACKGACCVEGDAGAPLTDEEVKIIEEEYPKFKSYIRADGQTSVSEQGTSVKDTDGEWVTPLRDGKECATLCLMKREPRCAELNWLGKRGRLLSENPFLVTFILFVQNATQNLKRLTMKGGIFVVQHAV